MYQRRRRNIMSDIIEIVAFLVYSYSKWAHHIWKDVMK